MNEPWKDSSEHKHFKQTPWGILEALTPEEAEKVKEQWEAKKLDGEMNFVTVKVFDGLSRCVKCGNQEAPSTQYHAGGDPGAVCTAIIGVNDHLHLNCEGCGFNWIERCISEDIRR
jgi:predicted nucleic-acid-binding Zn-ribbon protein